VTCQILQWMNTMFKNALSMIKHSEHWECDVPLGHQVTCVSCSRLLFMMSKLLILILIQKKVNWESLLQLCNCQ